MCIFPFRYLVLEKLKKEDSQRSHVFSSFFYKRLNQKERRNLPDTTNLPWVSSSLPSDTRGDTFHTEFSYDRTEAEVPESGLLIALPTPDHTNPLATAFRCLPRPFLSVSLSLPLYISTMTIIVHKTKYQRLNQQRNMLFLFIRMQKRKHNRVKTWTRHVDLFQKDFIFVPINES